jgi:dephospho-CoA kinase
MSAGKSTVCRLLKEEGAYVVDADEITHRLLSLETAVGKKVLNLLGPEIITEKQIDRKKVATIVFSNQEKLKALEDIIHPAVREEMKCEFEKVKNNPAFPFFVAEVPLLYEAHMETDFDTVWAVSGREPQNEEMFPRIERQLPPALKAMMADDVIDNSGDLAALQSQVKTLLRRIHENG